NDPVDHRLRLLRGRGVVQIDERMLAHSGAEDRKVFPDPGHAVSGYPVAWNGGGVHESSFGAAGGASRSRSEARSRSRSDSIRMRSPTSPANASVRIPRA